MRETNLTAGRVDHHDDCSRSALLIWTRCMEDYGRFWQEDIGWKLFSQEYWYLFVNALAYHWRGDPLNIETACNSMRTGSPKTKGNRLRKLYQDDWFSKLKDSADMRHTYIRPTDMMLRLGKAHLARSLPHMARRLQRSGILPSDGVLPLSGSPPQAVLLPWAEFLIQYTDDWNRTFQNRFHTEEYWYPFVYCLRAHWEGRALTMGEACESMPTGSSRTRETRIALAVTRGMLLREKSSEDLRTTLILPAPLLEQSLIDHFSGTLARMRALFSRLCE